MRYYAGSFVDGYNSPESLPKDALDVFGGVRVLGWTLIALSQFGSAGLKVLEQYYTPLQIIESYWHALEELEDVPDYKTEPHRVISWALDNGVFLSQLEKIGISQECIARTIEEYLLMKEMREKQKKW